MGTDFLTEGVASIEGIGSTRRTSLESAGISTVGELIAAGPVRIRRAVGERVAPNQVGSWMCAAFLRQIDEVDPNIAEAFVDAGLRSVRRIANAGLSTLEDAIGDAVASNKLHDAPSIYKLAAIQREASNMLDKAMLVGRVTTMDNSPVPNAVARIHGRRSVSDETGRFGFVGLPPEPAELSLQPQTRRRRLGGRTQLLRANGVTGVVRISISDDGLVREPTPLRESSGLSLVNSPGVVPELVWSILDEFSAGSAFEIRSLADPSRLLSLAKGLVGDRLVIERVRVPKADLPADAAIGDIVVWDGSSLNASELTRLSVAQHRWQQSVNRSQLVITI